MRESLLFWLNFWSYASILSLDLEEVAFLVLLPHVQAVVLGCLSPKNGEFFCSLYRARVVFPVP